MKPRKRVISGFVLVLPIVMLTSTAYGCVTWVGQFTVTTDGPDTGTTRGDGPYEKVTAYGMGRKVNAAGFEVDRPGMIHCWTEGAIRVDVDAAPPTPSTVGLDFRAFVSTPTACPLASPMAPRDGTYNISYLNTGFGDFVGGNAFGWTGTNMSPEWDVDKSLQRWMLRACSALGGAASRWLDTEVLTVTNGVGTKIVTIDPKPTGTNGGLGIPDIPGTESAICLHQMAGTYLRGADGAQAPIIVI